MPETRNTWNFIILTLKVSVTKVRGFFDLRECNFQTSFHTRCSWNSLQRAVGTHRSHYSIITVVTFRTFLVFLQYFASQWYFGWLEWVSTFPINPAERFGMQYLPPGGCGRSSESLFYHYSGEPANIFGDFCNFVRPNGTLGGWNGSQPSPLFLPNNLVCNTCHQGSMEGLRSKTPTLTTTLKWQKIEHFLVVICYLTAF